MDEEDETALREAALRTLRTLDLTDLEDECDGAAIKALARRAITPHGHVAALCVWPRFVAEAHRLIAHREVRIATVVNFPGGNDDPGEIADLTESAVEAGAHEIDMVIPYQAFLEGREESVTALVSRVRRAAGRGVLVKAILETGVLERVEPIRRAADLALEGGADFLKTSTGKTPVGATLRGARTVLEAIRDSEAPAGLKPAGGVRTVADAANYLDLADEVMGEGWATPKTFRIGASSLLDGLLRVLDGEDEEPESGGA